jgi:hypothetical protein
VAVCGHLTNGKMHPKSVLLLCSSQCVDAIVQGCDDACLYNNAIQQSDSRTVQCKRMQLAPKVNKQRLSLCLCEQAPARQQQSSQLAQSTTASFANRALLLLLAADKPGDIPGPRTQHCCTAVHDCQSQSRAVKARAGIAAAPQGLECLGCQ